MKQLTVILPLLLASTFCVAQDKPVTAERGSWSVSRDTNPMDNTRTILAKTTAETGETLAVRCTGRKLEIIVNPHTVVDEQFGVRLKFDDGKVSRGYWERAESFDALFASHPDKMLIQMKTARRLFFEYSPFQKVPTTAIFDIAGLPITDCRNDPRAEAEPARPSAIRPGTEATAPLATTAPPLVTTTAPAAQASTTRPGTTEQPGTRTDQQLPAKAKESIQKPGPKCLQGTYWGNDAKGDPICVWIH